MRRTLLLVLCLPVLAGCGGSSPVSKAEDNLGKIRSGVLHLSLVVEPKGRQRFGFKLDGPFSLGPPATARIDYTQIANGSEGAATLVLGKSEAHAEAGGRRMTLSAAQTRELRSAARSVDGRTGLGGLDVSSWVEDAKRTDCGAGLECVTGKVDVARATADLLDLVRSMDSGVPELSKDDERRLRESARSTRFDLAATKDDHLLRRARMAVDLGFDVPRSLRRALGDIVGATVTFEIRIDRPNEPVHVA